MGSGREVPESRRTLEAPTVPAQASQTLPGGSAWGLTWVNGQSRPLGSYEGVILALLSEPHSTFTKHLLTVRHRLHT